ncbi:hypothetical protein HX867_33655, partial [Pseudomonas gingeri]|uniref:tetratricopeptide repeat protein n=1 Tax=Pseudomonas gingeri TaxID=117681 RepID=UPI00180B948E
LKPKYEYAYYQRGKVFLLLDKAQEAKQEFEHSISLRPSYARPYVGMADALRRLGESDEARRYLELGCSKGSPLACSRLNPKAPLVLAPKDCCPEVRLETWYSEVVMSVVRRARVKIWLIFTLLITASTVSGYG